MNFEEIDRIVRNEDFSTQVVNLRQCGKDYDTYIGRAHSSAKYGLLSKSPFSNPFSLSTSIPGEVGQLMRSAVVGKYLIWFVTRTPLLVVQAKELKGQRLGCWCAPMICHGHIVAWAAEGLLDELIWLILKQRV